VGRSGDRGKSVGSWISVAGSCDVKVGRVAMGIDWVTKREDLSKMIPPAYCEFIGKQLIDHVRSRDAHPE